MWSVPSWAGSLTSHGQGRRANDQSHLGGDGESDRLATE